MKKINLLLIFSIWWGTALSQKLPEEQVPGATRTSFEKLFPGVKPKWEAERFGLYEAEFRQNGSEVSATFNAMGLLMRTETEVSRKELPAGLPDSAKKLYPDYKIVECAKIATPDDKVQYEIEIRKGKDRKSLIFDRNLNYLREEMDEDDDRK